MARETIRDLFKLSLAAEKAMQDYYRGLTQRFAYMARLKNFWEDLARDEVQHIAELKDTQKSLSLKKLDSPAAANMIEGIKKALEFSVKDRLDEVKDLDDAYEDAHELEYFESNATFKFLTTKFIASKERERFIFSLIESHLAKLMDFSQNFGDSQFRKTIIAEFDG